MTLPKIPTNFPEGSNKTGEKARLLDRLNAYNGKLSQSLDAGSNKFRVWDGTAGSQYCANLALSVVYAWIFEAGSGRRLSELRDKTLWDRRWGTATYDDNSFKDNDQVVIRLPSVVEGNVECFWRVYFSKSRDFMPVKWERLTQRDQQIASTVSVNEFTVVDMNDGRSMSFPMMITDESTGADEVSWVGTRNYVVNPDTLKINTTIEDSVFTLSPGNAEVLDTRIARAAVKSKLDEVQSKARPGWTWFLVACNIAVLGIVGLVLILRRRRNAHG